MQPKDTEDDLLDSKQVSTEMLGGRVKPRTLKSWRSASRAQPLPFVKVGGRYLYRRSAVRDWLTQNTTTPKINSKDSK